MYFHTVESDQLYTWSDTNEEKRARCRLEKTPSSPRAPTAPTQGDLTRLADRALQTLWQARVQMRRWSRPWPQVLSVGELPGLAAANGLCAQESHAQIAEFVANYHRAREILEAISEINRELLRRREAI